MHEPEESSVLRGVSGHALSLLLGIARHALRIEMPPSQTLRADGNGLA